MKKEWYKILPWMALSSGILVILLLGFATLLKPSKSVESTVNRTIALDKLNEIRVDSADSLNSNAFFDYLEQTLSVPVIKTKWLISEKGEVIYTKGMMSQSTPLHSNVFCLADDQSRGLIEAVECNIDTLQKHIMFIAASIRREGEHNDVLGHLVMPLKTSSNVLVGYIAVAYSLDDFKPATPIYLVVIVALMISFLLYWLLLPVWVYFDCRDRNNKYVLWSIFVLLGNIPALIAYLISNRK